MDMQAFLDAMFEARAQTRSDYHLTLGGLIAQLKKLPADCVLSADMGWQPSHKLSSYRGYYSDLAIEPGAATTAGKLLVTSKAALGATFEGYKGGNFLMSAKTPLWLSAYGINSGVAIIGLDDTGRFLTKRT